MIERIKFINKFNNIKTNSQCTEAIDLPVGLLRFIWHFLKDYKGFVFFLGLFAALTGLWGPLNSYLIKEVINRLTISSELLSIDVLFWPSLFLIINFEIHHLCWRGRNLLNYMYQPLLKNQMLQSLFSYVHLHSYQFFQNNLAGRLSSQIMMLSENVERLIHDISSHMIRGIVLLIASLFSMYSVHVHFFYILLAWLIVFITFSVYFSSKFIALSEAHAETESRVSGKIVDSVTNTNTVRIFARRLFESQYLNTALEFMKQTFRRKEIFQLKIALFQGSSMTILLSFMLYFLIDLHKKKLMTPGDFALILTLTIEVGYMTWWCMEQVDEMNKAIGKAKQCLSQLLVPLDLIDHPKASMLKVSKGQIEFKDVRFFYDEEEPFFYNKSVCIKAGSKVGLVGYSGSGKSTFVNLILRLYDIDGGQILIDHQDISQVGQESLRSSISMIPQDPSLFHRSLKDNIAYGKPEASLDEIIEAAKKAHAHEFIISLEDGYDTLVGERGIKLSGGQRQRIAIARALLKNAPILILDEATSQLDSLTEQKIQESLWSLMTYKTTLVIAHRLSTLLHMDRILVFDRGEIIQDGSHEELLSKEGLYKQLWETQVGGFIADGHELIDW